MTRANDVGRMVLRGVGLEIFAVTGVSYAGHSAETCSLRSGDIGFGNCFLRFIAEQQRIYQRRNYGPEWCCGSRRARGPDVQGHEGILDLRVRCQRALVFSKRRAWRL